MTLTKERLAELRQVLKEYGGEYVMRVELLEDELLALLDAAEEPKRGLSALLGAFPDLPDLCPECQETTCECRGGAPSGSGA